MTRSKRPPSHTTARIAHERRAAAEQLLADLLACSTITLEHQSDDDVAERRRVVDFAKRNGLVPAGKFLEMRRKRFKQLKISLCDGQHPNSKQAAQEVRAVPMPTELRAVHTVVTALQNDRGRLVMPASVRRRSLLFLHGLTSEAVRRGHGVRERPVPERYRYQYWSREHPGHRTYSRRDGALDVVVDDFGYTVTIAQESPESDVDERRQRLVVSLTAYRSQGRQYRWYDRKRVTIDDRIAVVLREIETRAAEDRQREIEAARQLAERRAQWEVAMERARQLAIQAHYISHLDAQINAWQRTHAIREYCDALAQRIGDFDDDGQAEEAGQWLAWARAYADTIDPLRGLPAMPASPELQNRHLEPFLAGWDPNGPEAP